MTRIIFLLWEPLCWLLHCSAWGAPIFANIRLLSHHRNRHRYSQCSVPAYHVFSDAELDRFGTTSLITRVTNDVTQLQYAVAMLIRLVIRAPFLCIGGLVMAMIINFKAVPNFGYCHSTLYFGADMDHARLRAAIQKASAKT